MNSVGRRHERAPLFSRLITEPCYTTCGSKTNRGLFNRRSSMFTLFEALNFNLSEANTMASLPKSVQRLSTDSGSIIFSLSLLGQAVNPTKFILPNALAVSNGDPPTKERSSVFVTLKGSLLWFLLSLNSAQFHPRSTNPNSASYPVYQLDSFASNFFRSKLSSSKLQSVQPIRLHYAMHIS